MYHDSDGQVPDAGCSSAKCNVLGIDVSRRCFAAVPTFISNVSPRANANGKGSISTASAPRPSLASTTDGLVVPSECEPCCGYTDD